MFQHEAVNSHNTPRASKDRGRKSQDFGPRTALKLEDPQDKLFRKAGSGYRYAPSMSFEFVCRCAAATFDGWWQGCKAGHNRIAARANFKPIDEANKEPGRRFQGSCFQAAESSFKDSSSRFRCQWRTVKKVISPSQRIKLQMTISGSLTWNPM